MPVIPDFTNDQHTIAGRKLGRGLDHFPDEGAKLVQPAKDVYEDEAYRLWALKQQGKMVKPPDLFSDRRESTGASMTDDTRNAILRQQGSMKATTPWL